MGDLLQLKPCHGNWIYNQPKALKAEVNLWKLFNVHQLEQNVRQSGMFNTLNYLT